MKKIICVDDSQTMRMSLTMLLTELDYEAKAFASGPVLLQALEGVEDAQRGARFRCILCLVGPDDEALRGGALPHPELERF